MPLTNIECLFILYYYWGTQVCHWYKRTSYRPVSYAQSAPYIPQPARDAVVGFIAAPVAAEDEYVSDTERDRRGTRE